ncbi:hypothetical protein HOF56_02875 [Candidatus Peribacteria bacterium]|jgi:hypothetical protein|nr:hypothetical protein [Candidatus Peribacteria bacterium]MBT4021688.1 hypothetical protein [Candidatus Peribacteria bacterium]MBT4240850.1 hypothetical protein [Candidatus Peribacteria bacterium]MBT4473768.1 hypothetical protein [Candidatus Peribacteria bacterium]
MKKALTLIGSVIILSSCGIGNPSEVSDNPLAAEITADQILDFVSNMQIKAAERGEEIEDGKTLRAIDKALVDAKSMQKEAHKKQDKGKKGDFYRASEHTFARGRALLIQGKLYFGFGFDISGAPGMKIYLSKHVAPHEKEELFSEDFVEIGDLNSIYGAQSYEVPVLSETDWTEYRTVAIYSEPLEIMIGLAQIRTK